VRWPVFRVAVAGVSMAPTYLPGDFLLVRRGRRVRRGQVVVVRRPAPPALLVVKRCVGVEPDGSVRVGSDNAYAEGAADSRTFGALPPDRVVGRVICRYWPPRHTVR
jgi:nickel-type superoxide dismutase maturation protease